ncbi:tetratricopeptide repeat protein [Reinekea sp.]|jgi:predicted Zn-dependent protease|uniref:tetratricopeptide repeat protein n=1 Tax=Reinekea sp. TaxID=1970455 RepID=UPI002A82FBEA|nr:tetratricopeptide repeat protein [Reinekea sp.]
MERASSFVERSQRYQQQGQFRAALIEIRNAIQTDPADPLLSVQYARLLMRIGSPNQAEDVLKNRSDAAHAIRLALSEALLLQGKYLSAQELLANWQPNDAEQAEYSRLQALQNYLAGNRQESLAQYRALANDQTTPLSTKQEFVALLLQTNMNAAAQQWTSELLAEFPADPVLLYYNARLAYSANRLDSAEALLTEALFRLPDTDILLNDKLQVLELLAGVLTAQGRSAEALVYSRLIRSANPEAFFAKQQYKDALAAASMGDLDTAKAAFEDILNQFPDNQQTALLLGLINLKQGDMAAGEALLSTNLDAETAPVTIIQATAMAQAELGKPHEALAVLQRALLARPDDVTLLSLYGVISLNSQQAQQGVQALNQALQLNPNKTRLHLLLAQHYVQQQRADLALGHLRNAFDENIEDWATTGFYLRLLITEKETTEAQAVRKRIITEFPTDTAALWLIAMAEYQLGNSRSSIALLEKLHQQVPDNLNVMSALGKLYQQTDENDLAANIWLQAVGVNPSNTTFIQSLVTSKAEALPLDQLTDWLVEQAKAKPEIALPLHSAAVELLINQRKLPEAQKLANPYRNSKHPLARTIMANILRGEAFTLAASGDWASALDKVNRAMILIPDNTGLSLLAAQIDIQLTNYSGALQRLDDLLTEQPNNVKVINEKVRLLASTDSPATALAYIKPLWEKRPHDRLAQTYFGLLQQLEPEHLSTALMQLLAVEPHNAGALMTLAGISMAKGDKDRARSQYEQALAAQPNLVPALNNLAWLLRTEDPQLALTYTRTAVELAPRSASVLDTYGWILHLNGNRSAALQALDAALMLEPNNKEILEHRRQVAES